MGSEWSPGQLSEIAEIIMGQSPSGDTCNSKGIGKPLLNGPTEFGSHHPVPAQFTTDPKKVAVSGDILFCVRGSTTGRMNWADQQYAIGRGIAAIRHNGGHEYQSFLRGIIENRLPLLLASATGSTFPNVSRNQLLELEIDIPPLPEQRAIAHILGSLDDKIELNRRMNETLEAMASALFKSWFIDFDPVIDNALAAGHPIPEELQARAALRESLGDARKPLPDDIRNLFPGEFEFTEEMGWIPKGWEARSVSDLLSINPTVKIKKGSIAPYADMASLPTEGFTVGEIIKKPHNGGAKFQNGDVLLARITPCLENGKTAVVDFLDGDQVGFGSTEFIVLRGKAEVQTSFVACLARNPSFRQHCIASMVGSSGRQRVQNACFDNYYITRPRETKILTAFNGLTEPAFRKITHNAQLNRDLSKTRETLIPKFLSGELRLQLEEMEVAI